MNHLYKASRFFMICLQMLVGALFISSSVSAVEVDKTQPYEMMMTVSESTFSRLKAEQELIQAEPNRLKVVVEEELMPFVNYRYAALKVLGPNLKKAKKKDVTEFIDAFHKYLVTSYAQALTLYTDQSIEFEPKKDIPEGKRITSVKVDILDPPRPNIKLEFKLRKNKKTGEWLAFDMIAEGVSMLSSKQSEWSTKLRKDGVAAVSEDLYQLAEKPIRFEGEKK